MLLYLYIGKFESIIHPSEYNLNPQRLFMEFYLLLAPLQMPSSLLY